MRWVRLTLAIVALASACTRSGPPEPSSSSVTPTGEPTVEPSGARLVDGSPLPAGCTGGAAASDTVAFVADGRAWALDPSDGSVACLFPVDDPGPFAWGPQGDRVLLADFEIRGVTPTAPDLPSLPVTIGPFDWGHPIGLAVVFADAKGHPRKRYVDDDHLKRLTSLPDGKYLEVAYHPSGLALAFVVEAEDGQEIWLSTNEGEDATRLIFAEPGTTFPSIAFTPNGKQLWWTARHAGGSSELHFMNLDDRSGFGTTWSEATDLVADDLKMAPGGRLKALDLGTECDDRQALVIDGKEGTPAVPSETRPTTALGWLDTTTVLVAAGGCAGPLDLYAVDGSGQDQPALLVTGVEIAAPRTVVTNPPDEVPAPPQGEEFPQGGVG
jgi:hypothetical protein